MNNLHTHTAPCVFPEGMDPQSWEGQGFWANHNVMCQGLPTNEQMIEYFVPLIDFLKTSVEQIRPHTTWTAMTPPSHEGYLTQTMEESGMKIAPFTIKLGCSPHCSEEDSYLYENTDAVRTDFPSWRTQTLTDTEFTQFLELVVPTIEQYGFESQKDLGQNIQSSVVLLRFVLEHGIAGAVLSLSKGYSHSEQPGYLEIDLELSSYLPQEFWTQPLPAAPQVGSYPGKYSTYRATSE